MQIDNTETTQGENTGIVTVMPGVGIQVSKGSALEYLQMRAAQLSALNHLLTSGDFDGWNQTIQSDAKWLAATLAAEVSQLASVVTFG
jgi:hypothetical protein